MSFLAFANRSWGLGVCFQTNSYMGRPVIKICKLPSTSDKTKLYPATAHSKISSQAVPDVPACGFFV